MELMSWIDCPARPTLGGNGNLRAFATPDFARDCFVPNQTPLRFSTKKLMLEFNESSSQLFMLIRRGAPLILEGERSDGKFN